MDFALPKTVIFMQLVGGRSCIKVINAVKFEIKNTIAVPAAIPASCAFAGKNMEYLAITTAAFGADNRDANAGITFLCNIDAKGKIPYKFGSI